MSAAPMTAPAPDTLGWTPEFARARLADMLRIRRMEERCAQLYGEQKIRGFLHLYVGEEAVATGVIAALTPADNVVATYREHGHALLRGVPMRTIMAEMYGREQGCSRGRGGSMHLFSREARLYGGNAIVGGGLPLAAGLALADKTLRRRALTACFFGEGAMAEGAFHEAMNLAALWQLPVLFCCENNGYAMGTALTRSQSQTDLRARAASYGMPAAAVDGMDAVAVHQAASALAGLVREGGGPAFLALNTYRFRAHSMFDPELYRSRQEVQDWITRCPIARLRDRLQSLDLLDAAGFTALESAADDEVADAVTFAEAGTWEPVSDLARDLVAAEPAP